MDPDISADVATTLDSSHVNESSSKSDMTVSHELMVLMLSVMTRGHLCQR